MWEVWQKILIIVIKSEGDEYIFTNFLICFLLPFDIFHFEIMDFSFYRIAHEKEKQEGEGGKEYDFD